ncbi:MAG: phosphopantetheine-binding protein, partial [Acutalibacteraceae bacterium]|nr:phosphopantetheine-binding protein [Acutalibacteraceae bacterium]
MIFDQVCDILADQLDLDKADITMDSRLVEDLKADSLDFVDLIMS